MENESRTENQKLENHFVLNNDRTQFKENSLHT